MTPTLYCARHPKKETSIRCGKCETTICTDCLVHSPVGMRCPDCARVNRVPTYDVTVPYLLRGIGAGIAAALILGAAFYFAAPYTINLAFLDISLINLLLPYLLIAIIAAIGYAIGECVSLATNRKRGFQLKLVSALSTFVASVPISLAFPVAFGGITYLFVGLALATWLSIRRF